MLETQETSCFKRREDLSLSHLKFWIPSLHVLERTADQSAGQEAPDNDCESFLATQ